MTITGEQIGALGVPQKVHTQKSRGKPVTASMEDYGKLQKARAEYGTVSREDANELIAGLDLRIDKLGEHIYQGDVTVETIKESLDPRIAKLTELIPTTKEGHSEITHITKGQYRKVWGKEPPDSIVSNGKVRWEYALDTIAQELHLEPIAQAQNKAPDEYLKELIEDAQRTKELLRATQMEVASDELTLKAIEKLKGSIKARISTATTESLLQTLAKPELKGKPKPERKAIKMLATVAQALIRKTQAARSPQAIAMDNALLAKRIVTPSQASVWAKNPNRFDIRGVDTPQRKGRQKRAKRNVRLSQSVSTGR